MPAGGIVGVIGPNGAGKTTLFNMITGTENADSGTITIGDTLKLAYVDQERVAREVQFARRMFADNGWPVIDVTRRSIEETAAAVINLYNDYRGHGEGPGA